MLIGCLEGSICWSPGDLLTSYMFEIRDDLLPKRSGNLFLVGAGMFNGILVEP